MPSPSFLGLTVKTTREAAGLTQAELAALSGISLAYVYALETGHKQAPSLDVLGRIADALGWDAARRASVIGTPSLPAPAREG
jgi:transcriptional regulator with XRE-family HTH domain